MNFFNIVIHPKLFFKQQLEKEKRSLLFPILYILLISVLAGLIAGGAVDNIGLAEDQVLAVKGISIASGMIGSIVLLTLSWMIKSGILNFILKKMGGDGSFKKAVYVIGISYFPKIFHSIINVFFQKPISMEEAMASATEFDWMAFLAGTFNIFNIWQIVLVIIGLAVFYGLSYKKTALPVIGFEVMTMAISLTISFLSISSFSNLPTMEVGQ